MTTRELHTTTTTKSKCDVVRKSSFDFVTDLLPSCRSIHPSGILHAFRSTPPPPHQLRRILPIQSQSANANNREEHAFAWVADATRHVEAVSNHFEKSGFGRRGIVFLPYSTKDNWLRRYPQALPVLECTEDGRIVVGLDAQGEGAGGSSSSSSNTNANAAAIDTDDDCTTDISAPGVATAVAMTMEGGSDTNPPRKTKKVKMAKKVKMVKKIQAINKIQAKNNKIQEAKKERKRYKPRVKNMLEDVGSTLPDAERDELHLEIYEYFSWLHKRLKALEEEARAKAVASAEAEADVGEGGKEADGNDDDANGKKKKDGRGRPKGDKGVDVADLKQVLDKMEFAFSIIPSAKFDKERAAEAAAERAAAAKAENAAAESEADNATAEGEAIAGDLTGSLPVPQLQHDEENTEGQRPPQEEEGGEKSLQADPGDAESQPSIAKEEAAPPTPTSPPPPPEKLPLLESVMTPSLRRLVEARENAGFPKRRPRKRKRKLKADLAPSSKAAKVKGPGGTEATGPEESEAKFEELFGRLVRYKEEHGDCLVPVKWNEDRELGKFVKIIREKRSILRRKGIEGPETLAKGKKVVLRTLTRERLDRLNDLGFAWVIGATKETWISWEERFVDMMDHYETHGKWPTQTMGALGLWVHKQRQQYSKGDKNFMMKWAPKLDEVGFEWTPRGNTRMAWDEGFEMLMEFGRINGHYCVPSHHEDGEPMDKKSDGHRLYRWVESLHTMYRSYKLGRQSGSLNDDRVLLLIKHGFEFRND